MRPDTPQELACLERAKLWEGLVGFAEEMGKIDRFYCGNLRVEMTVGACQAARREAKRRVLAWPEGLGWLAACHECPVRATEAPAAASPKAGCAPLSRPTQNSNEAAKMARPANGKRKTENGKRLLKTMSRAVARNLGLI